MMIRDGQTNYGLQILLRSKIRKIIAYSSYSCGSVSRQIGVDRGSYSVMSGNDKLTVVFIFYSSLYFHS